MADKRTQNIELGLTKVTFDREKRAVLSITTDKSGRGGVESTATVTWRGGGMMTFSIFGDFTKTLARNRDARATQKAIDSQHAAIFTPEVIEALMTEAKAFYAAKAAKK